MNGSPTIDRMSDTDALAWALDHDPRLRSPMAAVVVLDGPVEHARVAHSVERASRVVPRMRHRAVPDPAGLAPPRWEVDPEFSLAFHLRLTNIYDRDESALLSLAEPIVRQAFDRSRPQWEFTLVDGLRGRRAALIIKAHHAMSDGVGAVNLMLELFDLQTELTPGRETMPPAPEPDPSVTDRLLRSAVDHEAQELIDSVRRSLDSVVTAAADPVGTIQSLAEILGSAARVLKPAPEPLSPIMTGRSLEIGFDQLSVAVPDLRMAGKRIGGSINDAFIAGLLLGLRAYHVAHGAEPDQIRLAVPINTRAADDRTAGNQWTPTRAEFPINVTDPDELMQRVRGTVARLRSEPGYGALASLAGAVRRLPDSVVASLFSTMSSGVDVAASNVPGSPVPLWFAGRRVEKIVPLGPLSGSGSNITLLSLADTAHIGIVVDPAAVPDRDEFTGHLRVGLETVVAGP